MPSRCNPVPYCRIHCRTLLSCTVLPSAVKLRRTAESVLCYAGKLCRGNSYVPRLCETRLRQKRNKNEKSTHVRKSDPINSESHTRHSRNHPCPTPSSRKNIGPSPQSGCQQTAYLGRYRPRSARVSAAVHTYILIDTKRKKSEPKIRIFGPRSSPRVGSQGAGGQPGAGQGRD